MAKKEETYEERQQRIADGNRAEQAKTAKNVSRQAGDGLEDPKPKKGAKRK